LSARDFDKRAPDVV